MTNPTRTCIGCSGTDDHPRHVIAMGGDLQGRDIEVNWHHDCHSLATGCESCTEHTAKAGGKTGEAFRQHLLKHYAATAKKLEN